MDLIPQTYLRYLQQLRYIRSWSVVSAIFLLASTAIYSGLTHTSEKYQQDIRTLEKQKAISSHQRNILETLRKDRKELVDKGNTLAKLRGGATAENMFIVIDESIAGDAVWFDHWKFLRAGSKTEKRPESVNTGYFIVVPRGEQRDKKQQEAWQIKTRMEIKGQALDHSALSAFVRRVLHQPQISEVRVLRTRQRVINSVTTIDFELAIVVNTNIKNS